MTSILGASLSSFLISAIVSPILIGLLKHFRLTQPIRKELPDNHQLKKGTPLMAGIILFTGVIVALVAYPSAWTRFLGATFSLFSVVGFLDDFWKASRQDPSGVSGRTKLVLQFLFTGTLFYWLHQLDGIVPAVPIWKNIDLSMPLGVFIVIILLFVVGTANAINFTDGLDGLLSVVAIPSYFFFFVVSSSYGIQLFCLTMIASLIAFLLYNIHPAKAFMGDTGSLAIGGSLTMLAVIDKVIILVPLLFIIYFAEQFSVILQVFYYKRTGSRLFRMSPIHYHFALKYGWSENTIVLVFGSVAWVATVLCLLYWYAALRG